MSSIQKIEVVYSDRVVGRLALTKEGLCAFEYAAEWLQSGFSIAPFELPLRSGVFIAKPRPFDGGFGVFDDSLPDGWGLLILDRYLQYQGISQAKKINWQKLGCMKDFSLVRHLAYL